MIPSEAKQLARFPCCRIYRRFLNRIVDNSAIRKQGQALLFRYAVLFSLANFCPALRTVDGVRYARQAGEWVSTYRELCEQLHLPRQTRIGDRGAGLSFHHVQRR